MAGRDDEPASDASAVLSQLPLEILIRRAGDGDRRAQEWVAYRMWRGENAERNGDEAIRWYRAAAAQGSAWAQIELAEIYLDDAEHKDHDEGVRLVREAAECNSPAAQRMLARCYEYGKGVAADPSAAVAWYLRSAEAGDTEAAAELARCYLEGVGGVLSPGEAIVWLRRAADGGDPWAQRRLGLAYERGEGVAPDITTAVRWLEAAAAREDDIAAWVLGKRYQSGEGVTQDLTAAVIWFERAIELGHDGACARLGIMYRDGQGVEQDAARAVELFMLGTERGHAVSAWVLGWHYERGIGVNKDLDAAVRWYAIAAVAEPRARAYLRRAKWRRSRWHRFVRPTLQTGGLAGLGYYAITEPFSLHWLPLLIYVGILVAVMAIFVVAMLVSRRVDQSVARQTEREPMPTRAFSTPRQALRSAIWIAGEDGAFLLPLWYIGITVTGAACFGALFGLAHYPKYPLWSCVPRAVAYFFVALWALPYGIWNIVLGHVAWDLALELLFIQDASREGLARDRVD